MSINLKRRSLLTTAVLGAGAVVSGTAIAMPAEEPKKFTDSYDVVIVGASGAGLAAACEAVDRKLSVVVLESQPFVGGSSLICGGAFSTTGTYLQKEKGVEDNDELFVKEMLQTGNFQNDEALVRAYVKEGKKQFNWLIENGIKPEMVIAASGMSVPRAHVFNPPEVINFMRDYATKHGAKILLNTKAERLIINPQGTRIVGVLASQKGNEEKVSFEAKKGVLLSSGGFARNPDMVAKYVPLMKKAGSIAGAGSDGSGIRMALAYGADMIDTAYIKATYGFNTDPKTMRGDYSSVYYRGAIMLNSDGQRFVNESISYKLLGDKALEQKDGKSWLVFDEKMREADPDYMLHRIDEDAEKGIHWVFKGNTIEEAAEKAGLDPQKVKAAVDRYNAGVEKGVDEDFGRTTLSGGYGKPVKIENPPFYVFPAIPVLIATYCGIKINPESQVIDVFGNVIPGLWAAGEMTGGVHGAAYMTGTAFSKAQAFGRIAIQSIAKQQ